MLNNCPIFKILQKAGKEIYQIWKSDFSSIQEKNAVLEATMFNITSTHHYLEMTFDKLFLIKMGENLESIYMDGQGYIFKLIICLI